MSTRSSLAYIEYQRESGSLHIYFEMMDCKYYMHDERGGKVELPKDIAKDFAEILNDKYKHFAPVNLILEERKKKQGKRDKEQSKLKISLWRKAQKFLDRLGVAILGERGYLGMGGES